MLIYKYIRKGMFKNQPCLVEMRWKLMENY